MLHHLGLASLSEGHLFLFCGFSGPRWRSPALHNNTDEVTLLLFVCVPQVEVRIEVLSLLYIWGTVWLLPDIANLWGAYFEEHFFGRNQEKLASLNWAFYGRYIDDCLGIVYADSAQEALQIASHLRLDDKGSNKVRLLWEVSEWTLPFLDMLIYIDPGSRQIRRSLLASSICPSVCHA